MVRTKILVTGNCQSPIFANCLRVMAPQWEVRGNEFNVLIKNMEEHINWADYIYTQTGFAQHLKDAGAAADRIRLFPRMSYSGFHPDGVFAGPASQRIMSPLGPINSLIALMAYADGLSARDAVSLFCDSTYREMGYYRRPGVDRQLLMDEGRRVGIDLDRAFTRWETSGCFFYVGIHPKVDVVASVAELVLIRDNESVRQIDVTPYVPDPFPALSVWPVYPEIGARFKQKGSYVFKPANKYIKNENLVTLLTLPEFVEQSFEMYSKIDFKSSFNPTPYSANFASARAALGKPTRSTHPYSGIPAHQNWRKAVAAVQASDVDPVVNFKFRIGANDLVSTAGSCFAQHVARALVRNGLQYQITETPPPGTTAEQAARRNFGVFSARYGNIYTPKQLMQLIARAYGQFTPIDAAWKRSDGKLVDPFRPEIEPDGFVTKTEVLASRDEHLASVRRMLETTDVFVFTMGLTEGWRRKADGAVFPLAPGVVAGEMTDDYEFVNYNAAEVVADVRAAFEAVTRINPRCRFILTVSPVPLVATFERRHVLTATTYSKSVLRAAASEIAASGDNVDYFPSYEIITGAFNRGAYFAEDLREVKPEGVAHVMRLFMKHAVEPATHAKSAGPDQENSVDRRQAESMMEVVCEEERLDV